MNTLTREQKVEKDFGLIQVQYKDHFTQLEMSAASYQFQLFLGYFLCSSFRGPTVFCVLPTELCPVLAKLVSDY